MFSFTNTFNQTYHWAADKVVSQDLRGAMWKLTQNPSLAYVYTNNGWKVSRV
jgi:hypothetical protein